MRFLLALVAVLVAAFPANTSAVALRSEADVNSTIPSLHDLNETDSSIDGSMMEAGKVDTILNALSACKDMRSLGCWTEILNVFDSSYKNNNHDTNKGSKINIQSIIKHIVNIATIVKKLKGNR